MVGMEEKHRKLLRSNRMDLARDLDGDLVASHLYAKEIFNDDEKDLVQSMGTPQQKNEKVLDILPRKGPTAFDTFCDILKDLGMNHLEMLLRAPVENEKSYDVEDKSGGKIIVPSDGSLLKQGKGDEKPAVESEESTSAEDGKPSNGEDQGDGRFFGRSDKKELPVQVAPAVPPPMEVAYIVDSEECYKMDRYPRGLFLLLNNRDFLPSSGMEKYPRNGTDVDADALESLFKELGFSVHRYDNVSSYEMRKLCKQAARLDYSSFSCFVCAILSHGQEGIVYGTDGTVDIRELTGYFREESLAGKPKLFMFQACQGSEYMDGVDAVDGPADDRTNDISLPIESDFIYAYSTVPGYYSWRNSRNGSWFVQAIIEVFRANAHKMDVLRMLTRVNAIIATKRSQTGQRYSNNKRQISSIVTQLRKEFFLFPPNGPLGSG